MTLDNKAHKGIGLMSGTSLDGLDIVYCEFQNVKNSWQFKIKQANTQSYPNALLAKLRSAYSMSGAELSLLHIELGRFIGNATSNFIKKHNVNPDFISSHGHTVFHQPDKGITLQIGSGAEIAKLTNIKTVCDFRIQDVALGGQGAPLVPIGDKMLFNEYNACLNLGGFANISFDYKGQRKALDICPFNIVPNYYMRKEGKRYDDKGEIGKSGKLNLDLYKEWNGLDYYNTEAPKSLGWEFVENEMLCRINSAESVSAILRTYYEHITEQLATEINKYKFKNVLLTGGGVYNSYVIGLLKSKVTADIEMPNKQIIDYKEALIFAFLGLLKLRNETNILKSVTGAKSDHVGGIVYH